MKHAKLSVKLKWYDYCTIYSVILLFNQTKLKMGPTKKMLDNDLFRGLVDLSRQMEEFLGDSLVGADDSIRTVSEETFECVKGDYKTTLHCKFNKNGYLISTRSRIEKVEVPKEQKLTKLSEQLSKAVAAKDWKLAGEIQREIDNL